MNGWRRASGLARLAAEAMKGGKGMTRLAFRHRCSLLLRAYRLAELRKNKFRTGLFESWLRIDRRSCEVDVVERTGEVDPSSSRGHSR